MMKKFTLKAIIPSLLCLLFLSETKAQEAVFVQSYNSPVYLNPAMTGVFDGEWRLNANYRSQWDGIFSTGPIRSIHAAFDYRKNVVNKDYVSFSFNALSDETGSSARIKTTRGNFGMSYMKQLGGSKYRNSAQYLIGGGQIGVGQHTLALGDVWYDRQYDSVNNVVNTALPTGELAPSSNMYLDYNVGLMYYMNWAVNRSLYIGASMHHLSQPNVSFYGDPKENLRRRFTLHGGGEIPFNKDLSIMPHGMITLQGPSMTSVFGANFRYTNHDWNEVALRIGGSFRAANKYLAIFDKEGRPTPTGSSVWGDAFTLTGIIELNRLLIGASYDIHTSSITTPTNGRGAWELSLIYTSAEKRRVKTICPRF
jgi:type IX secretion system PorP/SprF family membrane protein